NAPARTEVENRFARAKFRESRRISATERGQHRLGRDFSGLRRVVEIRGYRIAARTGRPRGPTTRAPAGRDPQRGVSIFFFHRLPDVWLIHSASSLTDLNHIARRNSLIPRAAFRVEKLQDFLQRLGVRGVA